MQRMLEACKIVKMRPLLIRGWNPDWQVQNEQKADVCQF